MEPEMDQDDDQTFVFLAPVKGRTIQRARRFRIRNGFLLFLIYCLLAATVIYFKVR